jgi:hypothetical protein
MVMTVKQFAEWMSGRGNWNTRSAALSTADPTWLGPDCNHGSHSRKQAPYLLRCSTAYEFDDRGPIPGWDWSQFLHLSLSTSSLLSASTQYVLRAHSPMIKPSGSCHLLPSWFHVVVLATSEMFKCRRHSHSYSVFFWSKVFVKAA